MSLGVNSVPVICIDGPSGAGKGTVSRMIARHLGWHFLDSGALYRLVAVEVDRQGIFLNNHVEMGRVAGLLQVRFEVDEQNKVAVYLGDREVSALLQTESAGNMASRVAAIPEVRRVLLDKQRAFCQAPGLLADGRDMGTVVFPAAPLKVFLTASPDERARRRYNQLKEMGLDASLSTLVEAIRERDRRDAERPISPMVPAKDSVVLDSTSHDIEKVVAMILSLAQSRGLNPAH